MASEKVTLYDCTNSLDTKTFSPFVMRARIVMNLKKVPFETVWMPFDQIETTAKEIGAEPTRMAADGSGTPFYSIPFITIESPDGSKRVISDSLKIAQYFDAKETDPSKRLFQDFDNTRVLRAVWDQWFREKTFKILRVLVVSMHKSFDPSIQQYIKKTRERAAGVPWAVIHPQTPEALEAAWKAAEEALDGIAAIVDASEGKGSHRLSPQPTWHEIQLAAILRVYKAYGSNDPNAWPRMAKLNGGRWAKLVEEPEYDNYFSQYLQ